MQGLKISTSWLRTDSVNGRKTLKVYAIAQPENGGPIVVADATLDVPSMDIAQILLGGIGETLAKQPPEIIRPSSN